MILKGILWFTFLVTWWTLVTESVAVITVSFTLIVCSVGVSGGGHCGTVVLASYYCDNNIMTLSPAPRFPYNRQGWKLTFTLTIQLNQGNLNCSPIKARRVQEQKKWTTPREHPRVDTPHHQEFIGHTAAGRIFRGPTESSK